jgi:UDP-glucuronate 4-epimerase
MQHDLSFGDDIAEGFVQALDRLSLGNPNFFNDTPDPCRSYAPCKLYDIGKKLLQLLNFIKSIEDFLRIDAKKSLLPMQPGDTIAT